MRMQINSKFNLTSEGNSKRHEIQQEVSMNF